MKWHMVFWQLLRSSAGLYGLMRQRSLAYAPKRLEYPHKARQAGDTIVEVLICIGIVSLILAGAFVTTNRSQQGVRNSQEHAEALKLVESQLEQVRTNAKKTDGSVFSQPGTFCMVDAVPVSTVTQPDAAKCTQGSDGAPTAAQPAYALSIVRTASNGGQKFTIQATWDSVTGNGKAMESMVYRMYQ